MELFKFCRVACDPDAVENEFCKTRAESNGFVFLSAILRDLNDIYSARERE